jgi:TQXA domain-containing protein
MTALFPDILPPVRTRPSVTVRRRVRPRPTVDIARMTRYRGGTYSHTVDTVVFTDGTSARTDLIRLNPNVEAYSLDFSGVAPMRPSHYRVETWAAVPNLRAHAFEPEVDWILRNSFPHLRAGELSRRLRAAGHPLGAANISEHEAIAGTQVAIWYFTNGLELDNRPRNIPTRLVHTDGATLVEFDGRPELGGYTIDLVAEVPVTLSLEKSVDGRVWRPVAGSRLEVGAGRATHRKVLGVGATVSASGHGGKGRGYRFYRVTVDAADGGAADIVDIRFWLGGSGNYRNSERIVHLYNFLLAGARRARARSVAPRLTAAGARFDDGLIGPLRLDATHAAALTVSQGALVDADGVVLSEPVERGGVFYLRPAPGATSATLTITVPGTEGGYGGRVLTGVARDEASSRYTPLALAVPAQLVVDFDIDWQG